MSPGKGRFAPNSHALLLVPVVFQIMENCALKIDAVPWIEHIFLIFGNQPQSAGQNIPAFGPVMAGQHRLLILRFPPKNHPIHLHPSVRVGGQQAVLVDAAGNHSMPACSGQRHLVFRFIFLKKHRDAFAQSAAQLPEHINRGHSGISLNLADHTRAHSGLFCQHGNAHALVLATFLKFSAKINIHKNP